MAETANWAARWIIYERFNDDVFFIDVVFSFFPVISTEKKTVNNIFSLINSDVRPQPFPLLVVLCGRVNGQRPYLISPRGGKKTVWSRTEAPHASWAFKHRRGLSARRLVGASHWRWSAAAGGFFTLGGWEVSLVLHIVMGAFFFPSPCGMLSASTRFLLPRQRRDHASSTHPGEKWADWRPTFSISLLLWTHIAERRALLGCRVEGTAPCLIFHRVNVESKASVVPCKVSLSCHAGATGSWEVEFIKVRAQAHHLVDFRLW